MKKNVGKTDKIIRYTIAAVLTLVAVLTQTWWLLIIALAAAVTAFVGFCGLYRVFGIGTCPIENNKDS